MPKVTLKKVKNKEVYTNKHITIAREQGLTPNGNKMNGRWVLRVNDKITDFDFYINDLIDRNNINIYKII